MPWSIIILGLIGLAVGGSTGLLIGLGLGYVVTRLLPRLLRHGLAQVQGQLLESIFTAMGALSKADGQVTRDEIQMAEALFDRMRLNAEQRQAAKAAFNRGKAPDFDLDGEMARLRRISRGRGPLSGLFLQVQLQSIAADGRIHPAEHDMLVRMARALGLADSEVARLEALLRAASGTAGPAETSGTRLADAYAALGVEPSASDAHIKRAYRRLMSENHPDKLAGRGLPESMREIAEERTREITAAYRVITEAREQTPQ